MAVTSFFYGNAFVNAFLAKINFDTDTIKVALCTSSYTPAQDTHDFYDDITNQVANGNGYTTGGATLANTTVTYTGATNILKLDADDVSWPTSTITARYAVVYDDTPATAATKPLICYIDFGQDVSSSGGTFSITWDPAGIATVTVS